MDRVRFGRALGYGARHAAKTLLEASKAASATSPHASTSTPLSPGAPAPSRQTSVPTLRDAAANALEAHRTVTRTKQHVHKQVRTAGRSAFAPLKRAGGVLWLEMTGSVFAVFALFMAPGLWKLRGSLHAPPGSSEAHKLYLYSLLFALFVYFSVSSFVRAHRRGQRP